MEVLGQPGDPVAESGLVRSAVAALVVGDDLVAVGEPIDLELEQLRRLRPAVDQDQGPTGSRLDVSQPDAVVRRDLAPPFVHHRTPPLF
jgi:hypothetical protein